MFTDLMAVLALLNASPQIESPVVYRNQAEALASISDSHVIDSSSSLPIVANKGEGTDALSDTELETYLVSAYGNEGYSEWDKDPSSSVDVSNVYGSLPTELSESDQNIAEAKKLAGITAQYVGCGPLALLNELVFLASGPGYCELMSSVYSDNSFVDLATQVFKEVPTFSLGSNGTFTYPADLVWSAGTILERVGLCSRSSETVIDEEGNETTKWFYTNNSQFTITHSGLTTSGDSNAKLVKNSIDRGLPVIFYTFALDGSYGDINFHMMNIYGYERWVSQDSDGNSKENYFYKINLNWGETADKYIPESYLYGFLRCGFIYFEEQFDHIGLTPADHSFLPCAYNNEAQTATISKNGFDIDMEYLRLGYIDAYTSSGSFSGKRLVLSCIRDDYRDAYVRYDFKRKIKSLCLRLKVWNANDFNPSGNRYCVLKLFRKDGMLDYPYNISLDGLSTSYDSPSCFRPSFLKEDYGFSLNVWSDIGLGSGRNRGRLVIQGVSVCFAD